MQKKRLIYYLLQITFFWVTLKKPTHVFTISTQSARKKKEIVLIIWYWIEADFLHLSQQRKLLLKRWIKGMDENYVKFFTRINNKTINDQRSSHNSYGDNYFPGFTKGNLSKWFWLLSFQDHVIFFL